MLIRMFFTQGLSFLFSGVLNQYQSMKESFAELQSQILNICVDTLVIKDK